MNTNEIKNIFAETEKKGADVLKEFQTFVDCIPLPEGAKQVSIKPSIMNGLDLEYSVDLVWETERAYRTTNLFKFSLELEKVFPVAIICGSTKLYYKSRLLESGFQSLAHEVAAKIRGQVALKEARNLETTFLCMKPETPPLMIQVEK